MFSSLTVLGSAVASTTVRAARILEMLLVLQNRGRTTAAVLATELEVSTRTVLRDVAALSEAGIPIYTVQGAEGGIELVEGFQTRLTAMTSDEASAFFLAGEPALAHRLGLGVAARSARQKLLTALTAESAAAAESLGAWFLHDPDPWPGHRIPHGELGRLATCIERSRKVELTLGAAPPTIVEPLAIVHKAGAWHLVVADDDGPRPLAIDDLQTTRITRHRFTPPADFDLALFWAHHIATERRAGLRSRTDRQSR